MWDPAEDVIEFEVYDEDGEVDDLVGTCEVRIKEVDESDDKPWLRQALQVRGLGCGVYEHK